MTLPSTCHATSGCGAAGCFSGYHLPTPTTVVITYRTGSGNVYHLDRDCPALRGAGTHRATHQYLSVRNQICSRCGTCPGWWADWSGVAKQFARQAKAILSADPGANRRIAADKAASVGRARKMLLGKTWPDPLQATADELTTLAEQILATAEAGWMPASVPTATVQAAAAVLIGVDDHPHYAMGHPPRTAELRHAARHAPWKVIDKLWSSWLDRHFDPAVKLNADDAFPGRMAAFTDLIGSWNTARDQILATAPAGSHLVTVPAAAGQGADRSPSETVNRIGGVLADHPVHVLPAGQGRGQIHLVLAPDVIVQVLAATGWSNSGYLCPVAAGDEVPQLITTALPLWESNRLADLRAAFDAAKLLLQY
jgi:hypothetical protein